MMCTVWCIQEEKLASNERAAHKACDELSFVRRGGAVTKMIITSCLAAVEARGKQLGTTCRKLLFKLKLISLPAIFQLQCIFPTHTYFVYFSFIFGGNKIARSHSRVNNVQKVLTKE
jgi:hypothetical protein